MPFRSSPLWQVFIPLLSTGLSFAQQQPGEIEHGTFQPASLTMSLSSSPGLRVDTVNSNFGDHWVLLNEPSPATTGVMMASITENLSGIGTPSINVVGNQYALATAKAGAIQGEFNQDTAMAWFPYSHFLGGVSSNSMNDGPITGLVASAGIDLGEEFIDNGDGTYTVDITGLGAHSTDGILLVTAVSNENNFALSKSNPTLGTYTIYCHDNNTDGTVYERDPVAFVYIPEDHDIPQIVATGRILAGGFNSKTGDWSFTRTTDGVYHLSIPGHSAHTGTLIISPEGGQDYNVDNVWTQRWDEAAQHWVITTRDLPALGSQDLGNLDKAFSFVFLTNPPIHVDPSAAPDGDGQTWQSAYQDLNDGLAASHPRDTIWVAEGTYKPNAPRTNSFIIQDDVEIYGGFPPGGGDGTFAARDPNPATNNTVLSGDLLGDDGPNFANRSDNVHHVISTHATSATTRVDGFTIRGGQADGPDHHRLGGGIFNGNGSPYLVNLILESNFAHFGAGMHQNRGVPTLVNVIARDNEASIDGGGLYSTNGTTLRGDNLLFARNKAERGAAIRAFSTQLTLTNATLVDNEASIDSGALYGSGSHTLTNSIVWGNTAPSNPNFSTSFALKADNLIEGEAGASDPHFANTDYDLSPLSPALDAGRADHVSPDTLDLDRDGNVLEKLPTDVASYWRFSGSAIDLGAREACFEVSNLDRTVLTESWEVGLDPGGVTDFLPNGWIAEVRNSIWRPGPDAIGPRFDDADPLASPAHGNNTLYIDSERAVYKRTDILLEAGKTYTMSAAIGGDRAVDFSNWQLILRAGAENTGEVVGFMNENSPGAVNPSPGQWALNRLVVRGDEAPASTLNQPIVIMLRNSLNGTTAYFDNVRLTVTGESDLVTATPVPGSVDVNVSAAISMTFASALDPSTINASTVTVSGSISGTRTGAVGLNENVLTFTPNQAFAAGETVTIQLGETARTLSGETLGDVKLVYQTALSPELEARARQNESRPGSATGNMVDTATGAFRPSFTPITVNGVRPLDFPILYNSLFTANTGALGYGWSHGYETRLTGDPHGTLSVMWDATRRNSFAFNEPGEPYTPLEVAVQYAELIRRADGYWWLTLHDGTVYEFNAEGRLERLGNKVFQWLEMRYQLGKLVGIYEPIAEKLLTLFYNEHDLISGISDDLGREVFFLYDDRQRLLAVTDPLYYGEDLIGVPFGPKNIPDNSAVGLTHSMTFDGDGTVGRLRVETGSFAHARIADLKLTLTSPSGRSVVIHDREDHDPSFVGMIIDDFDGESAKGNWQLWVQDLAAGTAGFLQDWSMRFTGPTNSAIYAYEDGAFPAAGRLLKAEDVFGVRYFANTYDADGRVLTQDDGHDNNELSTFTYQSLPGGAVRTVHTDRMGQPYTYAHEDQRRLTQVVDPIGSTVRFEHNARGDRTKHIDPVGVETRFEYDDRGNLVKVIEPGFAAREIPFEYDERRNVTSLHNWPQSTKLSYDELNNATELRQLSGKLSRNDYDASSQISTITDFRLEESNNEDVQEVEVSWDGTTGKERTVTLPDGGTIVYLYDAIGRLVRTTNAEGLVTEDTYSQTGQRISQTDPLGNVIQSCFDHRDRLVLQIDKNGHRTTYAYDANDNLIAQTNALGETTTITYDGEDRVIATTTAAGQTTQQIRDASGQIIERVDPAGRRTYYQYNLAGQETRRYRDDGRQILQATYTNFGQIATETDANGVLTSYDYTNVLKQPQNVTVGGTRTVGATRSQWASEGVDRDQRPISGPGGTRDFRGSLVEELANKAGHETTFQYNDSQQVSRVQTVTSNGTLTQSYDYDNRGLMTKETSSSGREITFAYDDLGRLTNATPKEANDFRKTFTYDANGNLITATRNDGNGSPAKTVQREYDALNRLIRFTDADNQTLRFQYNTAGTISAIIYPDGKVVQYTYDSSNRITSVTDWASRVTRYRYDRHGYIDLIEFPNGTRREMVYDATGAMRSRVDLDVNGQLIVGYTYEQNHPQEFANERPLHAESPYIPTNVTMTYDEADRLATYNGSPVTFDLNGNMTQGPAGLGAMRYDAYNNLIAAGATTYEYDAEDHLVGWETGGQQTRLVVDPGVGGLSRILVKRNPNGTTTNFVYGVGLIYEETSGATKTFHHDHRGSTIALSHDSGFVAGRVAYGPHGEMHSRTGDTDTLFLYNGLYGVLTDPQGLVNMRFRWYSPVIKRFISRDAHFGSILRADSMNRYAYASNNPINGVDPHGEEVITCTLALAAITGAVISVGVTIAVDLADGSYDSTPKQLAAAALGGAVSGVLVVAFPGGGGALLAGAAGGGVESLVNNGFDDLGQVAVDAGLGAVFGKLGGGARRGVSKGGKKLAKTLFKKSTSRARPKAVRGWGDIIRQSVKQEIRDAPIELIAGIPLGLAQNAARDRIAAIRGGSGEDTETADGEPDDNIQIQREALSAPQVNYRRYGSFIHWSIYIGALELAGRPIPAHPNNTISNF